VSGNFKQGINNRELKQRRQRRQGPRIVNLYLTGIV